MGETARHMLTLNDKPKGESQKITQYVAAATAGLGAVVAGTILAWTSPVLIQMTYNENTTSTSSIIISVEEGSWVSSILAIGALALAVPIGALAEMVGRKITILGLIIPFLLSWLLIIFATGLPMLYAGRFFAGVGTGGVCVTVPMYISEIAETSIRGALGSFFQLFLTIGILLTYVIGGYTYWQTLSIISAIIPILFVFAFFFMPETPQYLLKKSRLREAEHSLRWLRGPHYDISGEIEAMQRDVDVASQNKASLKDLVVNRTNRMALICSLGLMFFQQTSGINAVIFYTVPIFKSSGTDIPPTIASIVIGIVQTIFTVVSFLLIEKAGRRILLLQSSIIMGLCLAVLGVFFKLQYDNYDISNIGWIPLASMVIFIITFSLGFGPIPWMMMGELFSTECKGVASGIAVMFNWILVFLVTKIFPIMVKDIKSHNTFWVFAGFMVLATIFVWFVIPETKGKTSAQIQQHLAGK